MFQEKIYAAFIVLLSALLLLSGCSQPQEDITMDSPTGKNGSSAPVSEEGTWTGLGGCYKISPVESAETYTCLLVYEDELYTTVIDTESEDISMRLQRGPDTLYETSFIDAITAGAEETADYGITVNKEIWERQIEKALSASADAEEYIPFDETDVAKLYDLFDRCVYYGTASQEILNIIQEEASAMFAGAKSARETAHVIQSRAGILVAE